MSKARPSRKKPDHPAAREAVQQQTTPKQQVLAPVAARLVDEGRKQSHYLIDTLSKTALSIVGGEGAIEKVAVIERLWAMQKDAEDRAAEREFSIAKVAVAMELPPIPKNHKIEFIDKNNNKRETPYATRDDIESVLDPICQKHGFSKEYSTHTVDGKACQILTVRHVGGWKVEYRSPYMPLDTTGSKNNNQAAGSTSEYGMRYALKGAFNIKGVDKDDDGNLGKNPEEAKPKDAFAARVEEQTPPQSISEENKLHIAANTLFELLSKANTKQRRGEILMKNIRVVSMLDEGNDEHKAQAAAIRKLAEEEPSHEPS
jgi:hypothetical protein